MIRPLIAIALLAAPAVSAATIAGTVRDAVTKKPLALVTIFSPQGKAPVESTSSGAWKVELDDEQPIDYPKIEIHAKKKGYETYREHAENMLRVSGSYVIDLVPSPAKKPNWEAAPKTTKASPTTKVDKPPAAPPKTEPSTGDWASRQAALVILQTDRPRALVSILTIAKGVRDPVESVRLTAVATIQQLRLQHRATTEALMAATLERSDYKTTCAAAEALSVVAADIVAAQKAIKTIVADGEIAMRLCATRALVRIDPAASEIDIALSAGMLYPDPATARTALEIALSNQQVAERSADSLAAYFLNGKEPNKRRVLDAAEKFEETARNEFVASLLRGRVYWNLVGDLLSDREEQRAGPTLAKAITRAALEGKAPVDCFDAVQYARAIRLAAIEFGILTRAEAAEKLLEASRELAYTVCDWPDTGRQAYFKAIDVLGRDALPALKSIQRQGRPDADWILSRIYLNSRGEDTEAHDAFAAMLDSTRGEVQLDAVRMLAGITPAPNERVLRLLIKAASVENSLVATTAIKALAEGPGFERERELAFRNAAANLTLDSATRIEALKAISKLPSVEPATLEALLFTAKSATDNLRSWAIGRIAERGAGAIPLLTPLLDVRRAKGEVELAFDVIERMKAKAAPTIPALLRLFGSMYEERVIDALGAIGWSPEYGEQVVAALITVLRARAREIDDRAEAAEVLGKFGPAAEAALPHLRTLLGDANESVRRNASGAIAKIAH